MSVTDTQELFAPVRWFAQGRGPRYQQLARHIGDAIRAGLLAEGDQIPAERDLAEIADVSRVTIRKAVSQLVADGLIEQRRGSGSFVRPEPAKAQQSLSSLISFTEAMTARGMTSSSKVLMAGLLAPTPEELLTLGLGTTDNVARIRRLRSADAQPMALETSALPADILPAPQDVTTSIYAVLRRNGCPPTRAIQKVSASAVSADDAQLLGLEAGAPVLLIDRTAYLETGRPIEFTRGIYRPDLYDFVTELRIEAHP